MKKFGVDYGVYKDDHGVPKVVVITVLTHAFDHKGYHIEVSPTVIFRDLEFSMTNHVVYSMNLSEFKEKFKKE